MAKATSVVDVILGEAEAGNYQDMLAIASVIANRAAATGTTLDDVISARGQFDAYGRSVPKGNDQYRDMAENAVREVLTNGPVTNATFYATPSASKNLPSGLSFETRTGGHEFYTDPQNRAIATAVGYREPTQPTPAVQAINDIAPLSKEAGIAAISPTFMDRIGTTGSMGVLSGFDRTGLSQPANAMADTMIAKGLGDLGVNSGYRDPARNAAAGGARASQHMDGNAIDLATKSLTDFQKSQVLDAALQGGAKGIGLYNSGAMHVDTRSNPAFWGPAGYSNPGRDMEGKIANMPSWAQPDLTALVNANGYSYLPSGINNDVPTPTSRPATNIAGDPADTLYTPTVADTALPPDERSAPQYASREGILGNLPAQQQENYRDGILAGLPQATPVDASVKAPVPTYESLVGPQVKQAPSVVQAPLLSPPVTVRSVPQPVMAQPVAAPQSAQRGGVLGTGLDVWNGIAPQGIATNGDKLSRNPDGTITRESAKYGWTQQMDPQGNIIGGSGAKNPIGALLGPFGGIISSSPSNGSKSNSFDFGHMARGALGGVAGGMVGGLLGPLGGVLGSLLGAQIAQGKSPLGGLLGNQMTPGRNQQMATQPGLGFPAAPQAPQNPGDGSLTGFGRDALSGMYGQQAQFAAENPGMGLW